MMGLEQLLLKIEGLEVSFYSRGKNKYYFVLRDVNIEVYNKQKIAIVGESGSGKTTLANSILLLNDERITTYFGNIIFYPQKECCNTNYEIVSALEKTENELFTATKISSTPYMEHIRGYHISMIFQDPFSVLNPVIPVGKQVEEVIKNHNPKISAKEVYQQTLELFHKVNLPQPDVTYNKYPHQLSGGQIQRICIATAIANKPEVIIADEPTTALDMQLKDTILNLLIKLVEEGHSALILITHDISIVKNYIDYVYILYAGEIVEYGPMNQILHNPLHPYTIALFRCLVDKNKKGQKLPTIPYELPNLSDRNFIFNKCIFLNRCEKKIERCETEKPGFYSIKGQKVKCFLYEK
ncbi:MAG: ABC transporter ATP-binding protein [Endomicrobia bacterium]|nr:ABC transporter ATP-binding protein [Endomicrobiia bacterium]